MVRLPPFRRQGFRTALLAMATCCSTVAAGCSRTTSDLVPVEGRVLVNGKPAGGAVVTFHPVGGQGNAPRPSGHVNADGTFRLTTTQANDGAQPGEYQVTVAWYVASAAPRKGPADEVLPVSQLPSSYAQPSTTPLKAVVQPGQAEPLTFSIKK